MQRKFLQDLALDKEVIDKILAENKSDIDGASTATQAQLGELTAQLTTAKDTLKSFEGIDIKELQGKITQLSTDLNAKEADYQAKIADMEFNSQLEKTIATFNGKSTKAVKAMLDMDSLKLSKNQADDIKAALEAVKNEHDYLFGKTEEKLSLKGLNPAESGDKVTKSDISKMNFDELTAYMEANPNQ